MVLRELVEPGDEGRKIKFFVRGKMGVSYAQFKALKVRGGIIVNGESVHANYILRAGDMVEIIMPELSQSSVSPVCGDVNIAYEDADIMIIDKPAPLACQSSARNPEPALENFLMARFGQDFVFRPLNRLDKGTSGLLCAAQNAHVCQLLQKQLHSEGFIREYLAIVEGEMEGEGVIDLPIIKQDAASVRRVVDFNAGKPSITHWKSIEYRAGKTLVRLRLETGRTHQIRVHLSHIGHPIVGDFLYGRESERIPGRFALHSTRICLINPISNKLVDISSPLPAPLMELLCD